ncbi:helix-turn-helix transcriptional regulator [Fundidesulfovibrio terrae]|uniref:helix-turn-helix transcriptional regulator n=1 Tax=Fundidesulfovibrio terrae TaxID=2922866 RepID=UPI001FAFAB14|nr:AlpA family phage regulatory protein [Fundidesulfovibrio terrae]
MNVYPHIPETLFRLSSIIGNPSKGIPAIIPVSKSTWWAKVASGEFPKPVRIGRCTAWKASDITALVDRLASAEMGR